jgi:hypothetical protein
MTLPSALIAITRFFTRSEWDEFLREPINAWFHDLPEEDRAPLREIYRSAAQ